MIQAVRQRRVWKLLSQSLRVLCQRGTFPIPVFHRYLLTLIERWQQCWTFARVTANRSEASRGLQTLDPGFRKADQDYKVPSGLFINNQFVPSLTCSTVEVQNPWNDEKLGTISAATLGDVNAAVKAASAAFSSGWKGTPASVRGTLLSKLATLVERDAEVLATIEAIDAGVLYGDSKNLNVPQAIDTLRYFAKLAGEPGGQLLDITGGYAHVLRQPYGVCAAIVPWNAPLMITMWKLAPALAGGNTIVIKTPELTPLYGQKLAQLIKEAGFPPGVVNIICGLGHVAGQALAEHMEVRKISFTGSGPTGRSILRAAANTNLKKVTLELGGKGASLVFADADLENALFWTSLGSTAHNGQVCALGSRIYVQSSIYDKFIQAFKARASGQATSHGDPLNESTNKGPLVSSGQHKKILQYIDKGLDEGASILFGGKALGNGNFVENTVFTNTREDMTIVKEEIFGPVAVIAKFDSEEEVIHKANDSEYGLSAAVFTSDLSRAHRVSQALEVGTVTVNCWGMLSANTPFGRVKQSGFGRDLGKEALEEWTTVKTVKHFLLGSAKL
ncbi:hypothetical protein LTR96_011022 [Exophiala xenobiotica]|nr:hypothetical protein LTR96_011022 [Exophiala xenobiotica]KAK5332939.1 hypothetical protein LTR98_010938 [Exophiala xenobiotica]KAK5400916.1 hypothetical protein LTR06_011131 [Exophiala xenobiotica]